MHHVFDPQNMARLDSPERKKALPAHEILTANDLKEGDVFLDIGAGTGFFALPAAEIVGQKGSVIAADISKEMLAETMRRAGEASLSNIKPLQLDGKKIGLADKSVDFVLLSAVLHEIPDKQGIAAEISRVLRDKGSVLVVEWQKKETEKGPDIKDRIGRPETEDLFKKSGLSILRSEDINNEHYVVRAGRG